MNQLKKGLHLAANIIFIAFIVVTAAMLAFMIKGKINNGVPSVGSYQFYVVLSGSMNPAFNTGSLIGVEKVEPEEIAVNDIITFKNPENEKMIVTHRVMDIQELSAGQIAFITRGDANNSTDQKMVPSSNLIGKENFAIPYAGYLVEFAKSKQGLLILIIIPAALVIIAEMFHLFKLADQCEADEKRDKNIGSEQL